MYYQTSNRAKTHRFYPCQCTAFCNVMSFESPLDYILTCFSPFVVQGSKYKSNNCLLPLTGTLTPPGNAVTFCCNHAKKFHNCILPKNAL